MLKGSRAFAVYQKLSYKSSMVECRSSLPSNRNPPVTIRNVILLYWKLEQACHSLLYCKDGMSLCHPSSLYTETFVGLSLPPVTMTSVSLSGLGMAQAYCVLYARAKPSTTEPSSFNSSDVVGDAVPPMRYTPEGVFQDTCPYLQEMREWDLFQDPMSGFH